MDENELVEVFVARDLPHAHLLMALLKSGGIDGHVTNEHLQGAVGELPAGWATTPRILVRASVATQAKQLLREVEKTDE